MLSLLILPGQDTADFLTQAGITITSDRRLYLSGLPCERCGQINLLNNPICIKCGAALVTGVQQAMSPVLPELANFWLRFAACGVDSFIAIALAYVGVILRWGNEAPQLYTFHLFWLVAGLYYWLMTGLRGQTLGKMLFHIKVVNAQGDEPGLARAFLREVLGKLVSTIVLCAGFLWIAEPSQRQGWHDKVAGTYVIVMNPVFEAVAISTPPLNTLSSVPAVLWWVLKREIFLSWPVVFLAVIGSILGLVLHWKKDRRKAWAIFCGGLFMSFLYFVAFVLLFIDYEIRSGHLR